MTKATTMAVRPINNALAEQITERRTPLKPRETTIIEFRADRKDRNEREVFSISTAYLRYRKDNGRITSDVLSYEQRHGKLEEEKEEHQRIIQSFLEEKDEKKTEELKNSIRHAGQKEPAIITCDGFLINGNRRKMVLDMLYEETGNPDHQSMKVVILPGEGDPGGPPTQLEIEQIENRYQLHRDGKAEYYGFDRALSIRRKIQLGMSLREQLRDDPAFAHLADKEFESELKKVEKDFLGPLQCIDDYLHHLKRDGLYHTVSRGYGDPEGRWQAFLDYYKSVRLNLDNQRKLIQWGVRDEERGRIEHAAFVIIRKRDLPSLPKAHDIIRAFPTYLQNPDAKEQLLQLSSIPADLPPEDTIGPDGREKDERTIDNIWGSMNASNITHRLKRARDTIEYTREQETSLNLLRAALDKLNHRNMDPDSINKRDLQDAFRLAEKVEKRAKELRQRLYDIKKGANR